MKRGERCLPPKQIQEIKRIYAQNKGNKRKGRITQAMLGEMYHVHRRTICNIVNDFIQDKERRGKSESDN